MKGKGFKKIFNRFSSVYVPCQTLSPDRYVGTVWGGLPSTTITFESESDFSTLVRSEVGSLDGRITQPRSYVVYRRCQPTRASTGISPLTSGTNKNTMIVASPRAMLTNQNPNSQVKF